MRGITARLRRRQARRDFKPIIDKVHATDVTRHRDGTISEVARPISDSLAEWEHVSSAQVARLAAELGLPPYEVLTKTQAEIAALLEQDHR